MQQLNISLSPLSIEASYVKQHSLSDLATNAPNVIQNTKTKHSSSFLSTNASYVKQHATTHIPYHPYQPTPPKTHTRVPITLTLGAVDADPALDALATTQDARPVAAAVVGTRRLQLRSLA